MSISDEASLVLGPKRDGEGAAGVARSRQCDDREAPAADAGERRCRSASPSRKPAAPADDLPARATRRRSAAQCGACRAVEELPLVAQNEIKAQAGPSACSLDLPRRRGRWAFSSGSRASAALARSRRPRCAREAGAGIRPATAVARDAEDAPQPQMQAQAQPEPDLQPQSQAAPRGVRIERPRQAAPVALAPKRDRAPAAPGRRWKPRCAGRITRRRRPRDSGLPPPAGELDRSDER